MNQILLEEIVRRAMIEVLSNEDNLYELINSLQGHIMDLQRDLGDKIDELENKLDQATRYM